MPPLNYGQLRNNRYALAHNWRLRIEGGALRGDLFGALKNRRLEELINSFAGEEGEIDIACTSATLPASKVKVISQKIRGIPVHQAVGLDNLQGSINLTAYEYFDYRLSKLFEAWKMVEANKYTLAQDSMARLKDGVNLDLLNTDKNTIVMTYRLLETYCTDFNTGQLGNDPNLVAVNFTLAYQGYDVLGRGFEKIDDFWDKVGKGLSVLGVTGKMNQDDLGNSNHGGAVAGIYGHAL